MTHTRYENLKTKRNLSLQNTMQRTEQLREAERDQILRERVEKTAAITHLANLDTIREHQRTKYRSITQRESEAVFHNTAVVADSPWSQILPQAITTDRRMSLNHANDFTHTMSKMLTTERQLSH